MNSTFHNDNDKSFRCKHLYFDLSKQSNVRGSKIEKNPSLCADVKKESASDSCKKNSFTKADISGLKNKITSLKDSASIAKVIVAANDWLDVDDKSLRREGVKKQIPAKWIAAIVVISMSLMLVVSGAVISSKAEMELYSAESSLEQLKEHRAEIEKQLELKNDLVYIENVARTKLGMIDREKGTVRYIKNELEDKVEIYEPNNDNNAAYSIFSALGFWGE